MLSLASICFLHLGQKERPSPILKLRVARYVSAVKKDPNIKPRKNINKADKSISTIYPLKRGACNTPLLKHYSGTQTNDDAAKLPDVIQFKTSGSQSTGTGVLTPLPIASVYTIPSAQALVLLEFAIGT